MPLILILARLHDDYVKDRQKYFDSMNLHFGNKFDLNDKKHLCAKDGFKRLLIRILYRDAGYKKWLELEDFSVEIKKKLDIPPAWVALPLPPYPIDLRPPGLTY